MKKTNIFIIILTVLLVASFTGCEFQNPIMETWWRTLNPIPMVRNIDFVVFAGDQTEYNNPNHGPNASSNLDIQETNHNNAVLIAMATLLKDNPDYRVLLQGHANPTTGLPDEIEELNRISYTRAKNTADALVRAYAIVRAHAITKDPKFNPNLITSIVSPDPLFEYLAEAQKDLNRRMTYEGYGGHMAYTRVAGDPYPALNRRVNIEVYFLVYR